MFFRQIVSDGAVQLPGSRRFAAEELLQQMSFYIVLLKNLTTKPNEQVNRNHLHCNRFIFL